LSLLLKRLMNGMPPPGEPGEPGDDRLTDTDLGGGFGAQWTECRAAEERRAAQRRGMSFIGRPMID